MAKKSNVDKFNFFVPATFDFAKGKSTKERGLTKIKGVCSSATEDSDGETLFPSGFDYSPFLSKGILNYNHKSGDTSKAIVGEPTHAEVINDGKDFYIEGVVYPNEEGNAIVDQAEIFEKYSPNRRFGFSIEGQALERGCGPEFMDAAKTIRNPDFDPILWKKILKARITGCAITPCPKNPNTLMSIMKGEYSEPFIEDDEDEEDNKEEKAIDTAAIAPATPESVEGGHNKKNLHQASIKTVLSKSDIYDDLRNHYELTDFVLLKEIYNFVKSVSNEIIDTNMADNNKISQELLDKAKLMLDMIIKGETDTSLTTSESVAQVQAEVVDDVKKSEQEMFDFAKSMYSEGKSKNECVEAMIRKGYGLEASQGAVDSVIAAANAAKEGGDISQVSTGFSKSELVLEITDNIQKSLTETLGASMRPLNDQIVKGFSAVGDLIKAMDEEIQFQKSNSQNLIARLEKIENTPLPAKSIVHVGAVDRFQKSEDGVNNQESNFTQVSVSDRNQKKALSDRMFTEFQKSQGTNEPLAQEIGVAIQTFEASNYMPENMQAHFGVRLVK